MLEILISIYLLYKGIKEDEPLYCIASGLFAIALNILNFYKVYKGGTI